MNNCPICAADNTEVLLKWKRFKINKCQNCRLIFTTPLPSDEELTAFYQGFMFKKPEDYEINRQLKIRRKELNRLFKLPEKNEENNDKKFLDYGGGTGIVFKAASEIGLQAYYQDLDQQANAFTRENFGLTPEQTIHQLEQNQIQFDYILSDNVIEHVKDPLTFTDKLLEHLKPGGTLVIKTPQASNTENYFNPAISIKGYFAQALKYNGFATALKAYFKRFWTCDPPRHLYAFSPKSFNEMMKNSKHLDIDFEIDHYSTPWFHNTLTRQFFTRDKKLPLAKSIAIRLVLWPIIPIETILQSLQWLLLKMNLLSSSGLILKIKKHK